MKTKTQKILALCNIMLAIIILLDFVLPSEIMPVQELDSFYTTKVKTGEGNRRSYVYRNIVSLSNGQTYRLGKIPDGNYTKGQKIQIVKSAFSGNIKKIIILDKIAEIKYVSILSSHLIILCLILSVLISLLNLFYIFRILKVLLVASTMFTFIFSIGYLLS